MVCRSNLESIQCNILACCWEPTLGKSMEMRDESLGLCFSQPTSFGCCTRAAPASFDTSAKCCFRDMVLASDVGEIWTWLMEKFIVRFSLLKCMSCRQNLVFSPPWIIIVNPELWACTSHGMIDLRATLQIGGAWPRICNLDPFHETACKCTKFES